jgi:hypothetical protein
VILFFVAFVIICAFFVLNLFIGVTLDKVCLTEEHASKPTRM